MADITPLTDKLYEYLLSVSLRDTELQKQLREQNVNDPLAGKQISPEAAQFLAVLMGLMGVRRMIEVGVFTGYSSLVMATALPDDGQMIACDVDEPRAKIAQIYWAEAGVDHKIDLRLAPATDTLQTLLDEGQQGQFDLLFIDADKSNYDTYYEMGLELVRPNGLIAIDNTLWSHRVIDQSRTDADTEAIRALNKKLYADERVDISLVPIGDGITLLRKRPD